MSDIRTEQPAHQDAGLQGVLTLYAPLLAGLRQAAPVDRQVSLLVDEAVTVWNRPGFDTFLSEASMVVTRSNRKPCLAGSIASIQALSKAHMTRVSSAAELAASTSW